MPDGGPHEVTRVARPGGGWAARKALRSAFRDREDLRARLLHEGRCLGALGGRDGVLGCHAVDAAEPALLLEWAPGGSLAERLRRAPGGRLRPSAVARLARELGAALERVHRHGLVHRDLKPSNVLFAADGSARLADFGVAAPAGARGALGLDWDEEPAGTLGYAAPEQLTGAPAACIADTYGLAAVLSEALAGRPVWTLRDAEDEPALRERIVRGEAPWVGVAGGAGEVLARALAPNPRDRFGGVGGFVRRVVEALAR